jgi:putative transposase
MLGMEVKKSYRFRLYPNREAEQKMQRTLEICRRTYNELLSIRQTTYEVTREGLSKFDMNNCIRYGIDTDISQIHSQVLQNINDRIDKAYVNFFRRLKEKRAGKKIKVGYPRFKNKYKSFTYPQSGFTLENNTLLLSKIGKLQVRIGRNQNKPKGKIKTLTIKQEPSGKWFTIFSSIEKEGKKHRINNKKIGIDVGLEYFAMLSNGIEIDNPRFLIENEKQLKILNKRLSRKKLHGENREKARQKVAILHERIKNQRHDFQHQLSHRIVSGYGTIAIEKLNIKGMIRHPYLAKHISDASWGTFARMLGYKASSAGGRVIEVEPRGTSQMCSVCGNEVPKTLAQRWHRCPYCGVVIQRDLNSARNILTVGTTGRYACGDGSPVLVAQKRLEHSLSKKQEATRLVGG